LVPAAFAVVSTDQSTVGPRGGLARYLFIYKNTLHNITEKKNSKALYNLNVCYVIHKACAPALGALKRKKEKTFI
jgi:hypothetical protein